MAGLAPSLCQLAFHSHSVLQHLHVYFGGLDENYLISAGMQFKQVLGRVGYLSRATTPTKELASLSLGCCLVADEASHNVATGRKLINQTGQPPSLVFA